jgi:hypothetical protein
MTRKKGLDKTIEDSLQQFYEEHPNWQKTAKQRYKKQKKR